MDIFEAEVDSYDGTGLFCRIYQHPFPRGIVLLVHGFGEHSGRYQHVVEHLMINGFSCFVYDQRCHGRSPGTRGEIKQHETMLADLSAVMRHVEHIMPDTPLFLFGHSSGGALVALRSVLTGLPATLRGMILSAPAVQEGVGWINFRLLRVASKLLPKIPIVASPSLDGLSRDPDIGKRAARDPYYFRGKLGLKTGFELRKGAYRVNKLMSQIFLPTLILHGTDDPYCRLKGSELLYDRISSRDKTLRTYDGYFHEILNEYGKEAVMRDITDWLLQRATRLH